MKDNYRIVAISDTHNQLDKVEIPYCDLLIHAGDHTMSGTPNELAMASSMLRRIKTSGVAKTIVCVVGNHDKGLSKDPYVCESMFADLNYLRDSSIIIKNLKIYGSPDSPTFGYGWVFNVDRGYDIRQKWNMIPDDVNILITHGPPMGILDYSPYGKVHAGCEELAVAVKRIKPALHIFGHFHSQHGFVNRKNTIYINASSCNEKYIPIHKPIVIDYNGENFIVDKSLIS